MYLNLIEYQYDQIGLDVTVIYSIVQHAFNDT